MPRLKSMNPREKDYGLANTLASILLVLMGAIFLIDWRSWRSWRSLMTGGDVWSWLGSFGVLAVVIVSVWGGLSAALLERKLGPAQASMDQTWVAPGESFDFSYQQRCNQGLALQAVKVFLVFRERVDYYDGSDSQTHDVDRLMQHWTLPGRIYQAGEVIKTQGVLRIPHTDMGIPNPYQELRDAKVKTLWVIKVRVSLGRGYDICDEYEVPRNGIAPGLKEAPPLAEGLSDVFLIGSRFMAFHRVMNVMGALMPHLGPGQIGDLYFGRPSLLLERITAEEAQTAKAQLEAAGAMVEVKPTLNEPTP